MSLIEFTPREVVSESVRSPEAERHVLKEYVFPRNKHRVEVVSPHDSRIDFAHFALEVPAMHELGDPEDEVRTEFAPYRDKSIYFLAFDIDSDGSEEQMKGMGRIIPSSTRDGNKSLIDLASIEGWSMPHIPEHIDPITGKVAHKPEDVVNAFLEESGCESLDKVWDISTVAFDLSLGRISRAKLGDSIISAFTEEAICEWKRGGITHCISFNEVTAHQFFLGLGYPFKDMHGLGPMIYDSFGTEEGMKAQPGWLSMETLVKQIENKPKGHLGRLALAQCDPLSLSERAL